MADFSHFYLKANCFKERDRAASFRITKFTQLQECRFKSYYLLIEWNCEKSKPPKVSCWNQFIGDHQTVSTMGIPENLYACAVCEKSFPIAKSFVDHVNKVHVKSLPSKIEPEKETKVKPKKKTKIEHKKENKSEHKKEHKTKIEHKKENKTLATASNEQQKNVI